ncbi:TPA: glycoside hydrolase family 32 protein [Burkholderia cepacia]|uniref:glycoside hydrolase family 32 protein n=1 Tax=Burkholderia cepacia TaxID=292 RepID=UPI001CF26773|nr:glycoside hydrolase family 32 protein [Burkholderia cepacia]MCA8360784.1 glycoside hydrolase family 32 protein [Burkholderia cepacia]HDR9759001.1 glycoside hydrolase family 32 protein [Burkholderia cepacia ATCC 25416]HDV6369038.1 glycoside hydrolase family 32 protein [Burkholderia cepacia]
MISTSFRFSARIARLLLACVACTQVAAAPCHAPAENGTPQWRPALHYTPQRNWMNDPNGLVYDNGRYHLFYQYNPLGNDWGNMSWGHATSTDLVHWREQPVAMRANATEEIFSGSIVADTLNTSGLGTPGHPPLVALYTSVYKAGSGHAPGIQAQSLAYSLDHGTTWQPYARNPVLTLDPESKQFRDPKVSWYAPGGYWLMTTVVADAHVVKLYRSDDLIHWNFLSDFTRPGVPHDGALWEMPDLVPLPLDGDPARTLWVMIVNVNPWSIAGGSGAMYFVGNFDGRTFTPDRVAPAGSDPAQFHWVDHGADFYAAGTFSGAPGSRPVAIAWMSNWDYAAKVPTAPWRGAMTLPRELSLKTIDGEPTLVVAPAAAFDAWADGRPAVHEGDLTVDSATRALSPATRGTVQRITVTIEPRHAARAGLIVRRSADGSVGTRIVYDTVKRTLTLDRSRSGEANFAGTFSREHIVDLPLEHGRLRLEIVVDRGSVEVFANGGRVALTDLIFPPPDADRVAVFAEHGRATFSGLTVTQLEAGGDRHDACAAR